MSARLALHLLGAPRLELDHVPIAADRRKVLALLAYLAVNRWQHHRDHISALFWPDYDQAKAYTNLRHILWEVQQAIGEGWLVASRDTIGLIAEDHSSSQPERVVWVDVARFKSLVTQSRMHAQRDVSLRIPLLTDSVNLYRNHFLTGFSLKHSSVFNEWSVTESEDLRHQFTGALTMLSEDHCSLGEAETAIPYAQRLVALDSLNEISHRLLMKVYIQAGQNSAALKQYQTCEQILRKELGVDPQPETRALYKQIRKGEFRPIQPTKQKEAVTPRHNLPFQISTFIGREKELDDIANLIANNRLVTLVGTGGIGKTRLALKAGEQLLNEYANGVWFVELASLNDPVLVPQAVAQLFHIAEQADEPLTQKLARVLRSRTFLIILDNCEHLLDASAQLADALLKNCPNLKVLVTSREPLRITGESQYHVPSLGLPDLQQLLEKMLGYESIQLFEERARLVQEHFSLTMENASSVAQICHRLDGIPLALELAAARVDMFSTEQIAVQLNESFNLLTGGSRTALPRQQTLRASIDWSWKLLSDPEQILLRRLSIFAGGWTLEAAEAVCSGNGIEPQQVLDLMTQLATKSLVVSKHDGESERRYHLLEMIRQYTHEKLQVAGEVDEIRNRHLDWVLVWAEQIHPEFHGRNRATSLADADLERDNIRLAIDWGLRIGQFERSMKICIALRSYLDGRIPYGETRRWLDLGLSHRDHFSKSTLARIYIEAAWVTLRQNDLLHGIAYTRESLKLAEELNEPWIVAEAMRGLGVVEIFAGNFVEATTYFEKAVALYQALGNDQGAFLAIGNQALSLFYQRKLEDAIALLAKYMDSVVSLGNQDRIAWFHFALGLFKLVHGDVEMALPNLKTGLSLYYQIKEINFTAVCIIAVAFLASARGNAIRAARLFGVGEAIHESIGTVLDPTAQSLRGGYVEKTRAMLDEATFESAWAEGRAMSLDEAVEYALEEKEG